MSDRERDVPPERPVPDLDEVMRAMDVVDTIRAREAELARRLNEAEREAALRDRLREIYRGQGIDVADRVLDEGIRQLKQRGAVTTPDTAARPAGWSRLLVPLRTGRGLAAAAIAVALAFGAYHVGVVRPRAAAHVAAVENLPRELAATHAAVVAEAKADAARARLDTLLAQGRTAVAQGDVDTGRDALAQMQQLRQRLLEEYVIRIVSRPGQETTVVRNARDGGRTYYVVVEAIARNGRPLERRVSSDETGRVAEVTMWAVRVPEATYDEVRRDKDDDGVVEQSVLGEKRRGELDVVWARPVWDGAITRW